MIVEKTVYQCICDKCGWEWTTRSLKLPAVCSRCKNHKWNGSAVSEISDIAENTAEGRVDSVGSGSSGDGRGLSDVE